MAAPRATASRLPRLLSEALAAQYGALFLWVPVCLALGIGAYFALPSEPGPGAWAVVAAALAAGSGAALTAWRAPILIAVLMILAGVALCGLRGLAVSSPTLGWRYHGPVEGRIVAIDRSASDAVRLTLDRVVLEDVRPSRTPGRVRLSLHGDQRWLDPAPGQTIIVTAHLGPPEGPVEPGGFDFQRMAWFQGLGAVGYARTPALLLAEAGGGLWLARLRTRLADAVRSALPGETGAFAAAITTGDRSAIDAATMADLRASNLAHLLAISGLHMGLLTGVVFWAVRLGLACVPGLALTRPIKAWAAVAALVAGAAYLALSGGNVATQRAFVMVGVMLGAVLLNRRAVTLRAVALAAVIVLALRPEALTSPGFQMSFAATTALVAVFRALRGAMPDAVPRWTRPIFATLISSAVAGAATAPIAAAHFNQVAQYGLLANLLSVPLMGLVVMPGAVLAACLSSFGLGWIGLAVMAPGIDWILAVARLVAGLDGALWRVASPGPWFLPLFATGAITFVCWRGRGGRLAGLAAVAASFLLWSQADRPDLLISPGGGLLGVMTPEGRALSKEAGEGFAARSWLENDGDAASQAAAFRRAGVGGEPGARRFAVGAWRGVHVTGRGAAERAADLCGTFDLVVTPVAVPEPRGDCLMIDGPAARALGALAFRVAPSGDIGIEPARPPGRRRAWSGRASSMGGAPQAERLRRIIEGGRLPAP